MSIKEAYRAYSCPHCCKKHFKKRGFYYRRVSKTYIPRYFCFECKKSFSTRSSSKTFRQKRPDLNSKILLDLTSGVSMRKCALNHNCSFTTVYKKFLWLSQLAQTQHAERLFNIKEVQFDEMESIEQTKLKPLTIAMAVSENYQILGVKVGTIPAKGRLAQISVKKYGFRQNESKLAVKELLESVKSKTISKDFLLKSDAKPSYQKITKTVFPNQRHEIHIAQENKEKRRELKYTNLEKRIFDPIFALNQRFAKLRDHIKRLTRRSWCTTKVIENLERHIYLYIAVNNHYQIV